MSLRLLPLLLLAAAACGTDSNDPCDVYDFALDPVPTSSAHTATCDSVCGNGLNPPTAGPHCAYPLACGAYDAPTKACQYVHNLEHGHLVLLYSCPDGCPDVVSTLTQIASEAKRDSQGRPRAVVAPAEGLPTRTAALLWRRSLQQDAPDPAALRCFLKLQDERGVTPEAGLGCP